MAHKRKRIFDGLYAQLEETDGNVVLFSARGEPSVIFEITNPVQQLCTDAQQYMLFHDVLSNIHIEEFFEQFRRVDSVL